MRPGYRPSSDIPDAQAQPTGRVLRRMGNLAGQAPAYLFLATIAIAPLPFGMVDPPAVSLLCIVLGLVLAGAAVRGVDRARLPFFLPIAVIVLAAGLVLHEQLSSRPWFVRPDPVWLDAFRLLRGTGPASASVARDQAFFALGAPLANLLALMCGIAFGSDRAVARRLIRVVAWSGALYAAFGIVAYLFDPMHVLWSEKFAHQDNLTGTFLNRNTAAVHFGACAILWLLLAADLLVRRATRPIGSPGVLWEAIATAREALSLPLGMLLLCLTAMALTQSRAGIALSLAALALAGVCSLWRHFRRRRVLAVLLPAVGLPVMALLLLGNGVNSRFDLEGLSDEGRVQVYRSTLRMIADHPWFGVGLGGFPWIFPRYRLPDLSMWGTWVRAHSTPLELAAELGLPLAVLIAMAWLAALAVLVRGFRRRRRDRMIPLAGLAVSLLALIHSCGDFSLQIPGFAVIVFALMGAGLAQSVSGWEAAGLGAAHASHRVGRGRPGEIGALEPTART